MDESAGRSLKSSMKIVLGLGLVVATVCGITFISQYTTTDADPKQKTTTPGVQQVAAPTVEPLSYVFREMHYDPNSEYLEQRHFQGFYEPGDTLQWVSFWVQNKNPVPVEVSARGRSCSSCSDARLAVTPPYAHTEFLDRIKLASVVPQFTTPNLLSALAAVSFSQATTHSQAGWQKLDFDNKDAFVVIPAATANGPTQAVLQLGFKVTQLGPKEPNLTALIGVRTPDMAVPLDLRFTVAYVGVPAYEVFPRTLDMGDLSEKTPSVTREVIFWSATRDAEELGVPIGTSTDAFVQLGKPVLFTPAELQSFSAELSRGPRPIRLRTAFRIPVTLLRDLPADAPPSARPLDIGPIERVISFATSASGIPDNKPTSVTVKANVTGLVRLGEGSSNFDLGSFKGRNGIVKSTQLVSDRVDLELEPVPDQTSPKYLIVTLDKPRVEDGRRIWSVKIEIKPNDLFGDLPSSSVLTFRVKGGTQLIRIPLKGKGTN